MVSGYGLPMMTTTFGASLLSLGFRARTRRGQQYWQRAHIYVCANGGRATAVNDSTGETVADGHYESVLAALEAGL